MKCKLFFINPNFSFEELRAWLEHNGNSIKHIQGREYEIEFGNNYVSTEKDIIRDALSRAGVIVEW